MGMILALIKLALSVALANEMEKIAPNTYIDQWKAIATFWGNMAVIAGFLGKFFFDMIFKRQDGSDQKHAEMLKAFNDFRTEMKSEVATIKEQMKVALKPPPDPVAISKEVEDRIAHKVELWVMKHFRTLSRQGK